jgi:asparagine synthase (glutamine-hydrolysing)
LSGFVGILNLDGAPVDQLLLERMTQALAFRGPDAQGIWSQGEIGLGHTLLRATHEAGRERQPAALEARLRIVADGRVDARAELIAKLNSRLANRHGVSLATPDAELILQAYDAWGESCLDHLLGDFSFAIWDAANRKLFCARDQIGIKPFYYTQIANTLIVSNTLQVVRLHPGVLSKLSDLAIGDFLLFGLNYRPDVSAFEGIKKLPPARFLTAAERQVRVSRYWSFPIEEPLRHRHTRDCIQEFRTLLGAAVRDRLRTDRASISLSGGLDSPAVAAMAGAQLTGKGALQGITIVNDQLMPDQERKYAGIVASHLGIPIHFVALEDYKLFERCVSPGFRFPEPNGLELAAMHEDLYRFAAAHGSVMLTGEGGDPGLVPSLCFYKKGKRLPSFLRDMAWYVLTHGRHPRLGFHLAWLRWRGLPTSESGPYPSWLEPDFESRAKLRERWREIMDEPRPVHPDRPAAYESVSQTQWAGFFEASDAGYTRIQLEVRHPLMDLRVLRFMLRLPTLPWCADKELLRVAMRSDLPEAILRRPKAPLAGDPALGLLQREDTRRLTNFAPTPELSNFIVTERIPSLARGGIPLDPSLHLRPLSLNLWLQSR